MDYKGNITRGFIYNEFQVIFLYTRWVYRRLYFYKWNSKF